MVPGIETTLMSGGGVAIVAALLRWGWKVDRGLSSSVASMLLLEERLKGAERVQETRADGLEHRINLLEGHVASNGKRA